MSKGNPFKPVRYERRAMGLCMHCGGTIFKTIRVTEAAPPEHFHKDPASCIEHLAERIKTLEKK